MTDDHAYQAEVLLSLAGAPETRQEQFIAAQTHAIIALVRALKPDVTTARTPFIVSQVSVKTGIPAGTIINDVRAMVRAIPDWEQRRINAIKELRAISTLGLKEAKDIVDTMVLDQSNPWW